MTASRDRLCNQFLVYGVTGYTGGLITRRAVERGMSPIAAGRNGARVSAVAAPLGLSARAFGLGDFSDPDAIDRCLADVAVLLNAAGPFAATAGFQTPVTAYGADWVREISGVRVVVG